MIVKGKPPPVGGLPLVITRDSALARNPMMAIFCSDHHMTMTSNIYG